MRYPKYFCGPALRLLAFPSSLDTQVITIFVLVYLGMIAGRVPGLALDRTGIALLGSIALLALGSLSTDAALSAVDFPTMALLFGLMVVSAQLRMAGFYSQLVRRLTSLESSAAALLAVTVAASGLLSALLANDIVCLAVAPILIESTTRRGLDPKPFLLALCCAANAGSAATLIGNPQNMLIGQSLELSFGGYLAIASVPALLSLAVVWAVIAFLWRGRWELAQSPVEAAAPPYDAWQTTKGFAVLIALLLVFLFAPWPRELSALAAAGLLLCSRRMHSRETLGLVDWQLLVLFAALFVVNSAFQQSGAMDAFTGALAAAGIDISAPAWLFALSAVLSNLVSNVPAVMLLLPAATEPISGPLLALSSTLAGNLLVVGSIANIIVLEQAARMGVAISWREHARVGIPVTLITLAIAVLWLWLLFG